MNKGEIISPCGGTNTLSSQKAAPEKDYVVEHVRGTIKDMGSDRVINYRDNSALSLSHIFNKILKGEYK